VGHKSFTPHDSKSRGLLRKAAVVALKVDGLFRSDCCLNMQRGTLFEEEQGSSGSRWGPLSPLSSGGKRYPQHVVIHLRDSKTGPREELIKAVPGELALCPVFALWSYVQLLRRTDAGLTEPLSEKDCLWQTNVKVSAKYRAITSADTIAKDTKEMMAAAGISEDFAAHALRGAVGSALIGKGLSTEDVVAKNRWASHSVFRKFYERSKHKQFSVAEVTAPQPHPVPSEEAQPREPSLSPRPPGDPEPRVYLSDELGQPLVIPGAGVRDGVAFHCFACWELDDESMVWCKLCFKHLHSGHFSDPAEAESRFLSEGWICAACVKKSKPSRKGKRGAY